MLKTASERSAQDQRHSSRVLWLAVIRYLLGIAQMMCTAFSVFLLCRTGASEATLVMTGVTTAITLTSVLIFRVRWKKP